MKEKDATLLYDTLQELVMALTDGFNTKPFVAGSAKAGAVEDALNVMLFIQHTLHPELREQNVRIHWDRLASKEEAVNAFIEHMPDRIDNSESD
jgi:hypothetical protein